jgi:hypothetical protein
VQGKQLRVDQARAVHHEIVVFCERLRLARGLRQRTRYPSERLSIEPPYRQLDAKLSQATTFTFLPWTRLADVFRHWQESSGLTILVDWRTLAELELTPATPISCSAIDRPWAEVLQEILEPLSLAWWAVDGETIQITTPDALAAIQRTEFYEVPSATRDQFASSDALVDSLLKRVKEQVSEQFTDVNEPRLQFDVPGGRLIARGNPDFHRHLGGRLSIKAEP